MGAAGVATVGVGVAAMGAGVDVGVDAGVSERQMVGVRKSFGQFFGLDWVCGA